jgi:hypothetical protein
MNGARGLLATFGASLVLALAGCIAHDQPPARRVAHPASNGLTDDEVHWYLQEGFHEFWSCWAEAPTTQPQESTLEISISQAGIVTTAEIVATTFDNPKVRPCIEDHIRRIKFPARDATTTAKIRLVFPEIQPTKG